jgi:hypothetical protein
VSVPVPPLAVQVVALAVDQVAVTYWPTSAVDGVTLNAYMVGEGGAAVTSKVTDCDELPPEPVQFSV